MMPRYSSDGKVCEIGIERRHYSNRRIDLETELWGDQLDKIFDELAPSDVRGAKLPITGSGSSDMINIDGNSISRNVEYQNISITIYGTSTRVSKKHFNEKDLVATIKWKNRQCK